ncbi:MAG: hypothetical protein IPG53_17105 [Ignavibacteriales bacterium]|nr:hypothetical protein [Ignavibacteriales bacterium]
MAQHLILSDLDDDGKTDFSFQMSKKFAPADSPAVKRRIYYGNENFDFSQYYEITDTFYHIEGMHLMKDLNNDGKGELIFSNQEEHAREWFTDVLSKGESPARFHSGRRNKHTVCGMGKKDFLPEM